VTFTTSCNSTIQPQFNRAVALMHSFQFSAEVEAFNAILVTDPSCSNRILGHRVERLG
jgi:hypothetical protein